MERLQKDMQRRGWNRGKAKRAQQKNKTLLGLVSNLHLLSSHQKKTAYSKGTVRSCLLRRITALKGSEEKQQCEFRCSCRVMRRVDLWGVIQWRMLKTKKTKHCLTYVSTNPTVYQLTKWIHFYLFLCRGKCCVAHTGSLSCSILLLPGSK